MTHDQQDALTFSDGIAILEKDLHSPATFAQIDSPEQIYHQPKTKKITHMFGFCNEIQGIVEDGFDHTLDILRYQHVKMHKTPVY